MTTLSYGDLILIWDALDRMPKGLCISYGEGPVSFEPTSVESVKAKIKAMGDEIEAAQKPEGDSKFDTRL